MPTRFLESRSVASNFIAWVRRYAPLPTLPGLTNRLVCGPQIVHPYCTHEALKITPIDYADLKRRIRDAVRAAIQERADELGISYKACIDIYFNEQA